MAHPQDDSDIGSRIVFMINLGMKVRNIGIDVCPKMPVNELIREKTLAFCQGIVAEIFEAAGVRKDQARQCWDEMVNRVMNGGFLKATTLANYGGWKSLHVHIEETLALQAKTDNIVCMPASLLASAIAAIAFRKLRPRSGKASKAHRDFTRMFGDMNVIQWLPIAIRVWERTEGRPFIIELGQEGIEPVIRLETREGQLVWIVKTRRQAPNIYESVFRDAIDTDTRDEEDKSFMVVPSNVCDRPLPSVENDERTPSKSTLPSTPDSRIDNDTLREYAREMKKLGKRLSSQERATVKRLRRGISEFADHADKKDQDMMSERNVKEYERKFKSGRKSIRTTVPKAKKPFNVYGHYKAL
ncbi:hypothetical protein FAVG1_04201 [Fusarium avenaceum]|nr:hypothetical protein FAVG1_04201 [Fusarium avenaceum]